MVNEKMSTKKLYDMDAYQTEFAANIVEVIKEDGKTVLVLDQTLFFPEEGGQNCDKGHLIYEGNQYNVSYVKLVKKDGEEFIYHYIDSQDEFVAGKDVKGAIDWNDRYDKMQNHTAEHILSGIVNSTYGYNNVGFHLNDELFTMDFNGTFTEEQIQELEKVANRVVFENVSVVAKYYTNEEAKNQEYRSKIEIEGDIRVVTIDGYDKCACCAPHVDTTGQVGAIKIIKAEKWKGGTRFSVLAGARAYADYAKKHAVTQSLARKFSTSEDKLVGVIDNMFEEFNQIKLLLSQCQSELLTNKLLEEKCVFCDDVSPQAIKKAVDGCMNQQPDDIFAVFAGNDGAYRYLIGSRNKDVKEATAAFLEKLSGKGGGNADMVQGMIKSERKDIEEEIKKI